MKKHVCFWLCVLILCSMIGSPFTVDAVVPGEDAAPAGEKVYCKATLEDEFAPDRVLVVLNNAASTSLKTYGLADFTGYNFKTLTNLTSASTLMAYAKIKGEAYVTSTSIESDALKVAGFRDVDLKEFNQILCLELEVPGKQNVLNAIKVLEKHPDVKYAGPDYYMTLFSEGTNDTYVDEQWALDMIDLPAAWEIASDNTVRVGVLDSGIDTEHPDLIDIMIPEVGEPRNQFDCMSNNPYAPREHVDSLGHGTMVAGIIAAVANNGAGIAGVCSQVELYSLKVCTTMTDCQVSFVINAINVATAQQIPILNFSGGMRHNTTDDEYTALYDAIEDYYGLFICAAGNYGQNISSPNGLGEYIIPAAYTGLDNLITVGASTESDRPWTSSNYSTTCVDIFAPGVNIVSCFAHNVCHYCTPSGHFASNYHMDSGTSYAAPYVTAVAAMILSKYWLPSDMDNDEFAITPAEIKERIMYGVDYVYSDTINVYGEKCISGGRLNAYKALHDHSHTYEFYNAAYHKYECACGVYQMYLHNMEDVVLALPMGQTMIVTRCFECGYEQ